MLEIERKFLVNGDFRPFVHSSSRIRQGYICSDRGRTVRVRIRDRKAYLTIKGPSDASGMSRFEWETEVGFDESMHLLELCVGGYIDKTRYLVDYHGHTFEVDEFYGENEGLVVAEIELESENETFERPPFLGMEVTGDRKYYNSELMKHPFKEWK